MYFSNSLNNDGSITFIANSDAAIVQGLIALMLKVFSQRKPQEILDININFLEKIGLDVAASVTCEANSGAIDVNIVGGTAPFTTVWSNGATELSQSGLGAGYYTLTVTDAMGCQSDTMITIEEVTPTVFEGTVQHVSCHGMANGAVDVTILEGTPDFIFEWDNGMMTEDISGLTPGTYRLKITNGEGCSVWGSYTVEQSPALEVNLEVTQPAPDQEGEIDLTVTGGTAPYTYTWNNGETSEAVSYTHLTLPTILLV